MTLKELSQLYYLNREIEMDKKRLLELEARAVSCSSDLSGMPRSSGVGDRVGRYDAKDDRMSGDPNQMNIQSMYSDIDLDANGIEMEFQASMEELLWLSLIHI